MLKTRIFTASCLLGLFLPALFLLPWLWWAGLMLLVTLICLREWAGLVGVSKTITQLYLLFTAGFGVFVLWGMATLGFHAVYPVGLAIWGIATVFWLCVVPVIVYRNQFTDCRVTHMAVGFGLLLALWSALVVAQQMNPWFLFVMISTIWLADSAAYFAGKQFGKHKLAPAISPGKTWEGVWGALMAVSVYALLLNLTHVIDSFWLLPALLLIAISGIYGDLFESFYKRRANLKDSGQLLPGHGGLLDRIDGVMPAVPVGLCLLFLFHCWQANVVM